MKFVLPHLGPDDVMAGDAAFDGPGDENKADTQVNVDKTFDTGKCALDYKEKYGNHLPWFMIKEIVGDDIWNTYTKFTIEREPKDRIMSLFYFTNPNIVKPNRMQFTPEKRQSWHPQEVDEHVSWQRENSWLSAYPDAVREYFEEWCLCQLESPVLDLVKHESYDANANQLEVNNALEIARKFKLRKLLQMYTGGIKWKNPNNNMSYISFPYIDDSEIILWNKPFEEGWPFYGQCRFLNYGNYFDGKDLQVDHVVNFKDVGNNLGKMFNQCGINIKCNKKLYDQSTQNAHYRRALKNKKPTEWWYSGRRGPHLKKVLNRRFFNDNMSQYAINLNQITTC